VAAVTSFSGEIAKSDRLYEASMRDYFDAVRSMPETVDTLLLVGHNPSVSEVSCAVHQSRIELPPAGYDILRREHWADFEP
jgi:phosphohistidine phosphatase